jgi:type IV pilus assembly protein PilQ
VAWTSTAPAEWTAAVERAAEASAPPVPFQESQQARVTASFDDASIAAVMANFAELSGKSIVLGAGVTGDVTAEISNQPWDVAFRTILESMGLAAFEEPIGVIRVETRQNVFARDSVRRLSEPLRSAVVDINYARAAELAPTITAVVDPARGRVVVDTGTNSLIITDLESQMDQTLGYLERLDRRTPQISIQAKLILVNRTGIEQLGLRYDLGDGDGFFNTILARPDPSTAQPVDSDGDGVPDGVAPTEYFDPQAAPFFVTLGGNSLAAVANAESEVLGSALQLIFSTAIGNFQLSSFLDASEEVQLSDLQAEPLISTSDNTRASILVGEETPIRVLETGAQQQEAQVTVNFRETGIILEVTPHVTNNRHVLLDIRAENSALAAAASDLGYTFTKQRAQNQILVRDGQTAVVGGLTVSQVSVSKSGIPFLVDLPVIGGLFGFTTRRESRQDLLILVTPHIIDDPAAAESVGG